MSSKKGNPPTKGTRNGIPKRKTARAPPIDKLMVPAIGIGLALLGYQFFKGIGNEIPRVDMDDSMLLSNIFYNEYGSNQDYVVLCHKETTDKGIPLPISSVFQDAYNEYGSQGKVNFRIMDCARIYEETSTTNEEDDDDEDSSDSKKKSKSKDDGKPKTIFQKFKLDEKKRPTIFLSGKVGTPKQIPTKHLKTGSMLVKALRNMLEPRASKIETTQDLRSKCLNHNYCALLMKGSKQVQPYVKTAINNLLTDYDGNSMGLTFASVDTSVLFVKNLEEYIPEYNSGVHRFVVLKKASKGKEDRLKTSVVTLEENESTSYNNMKKLIQDVTSSKLTPQKVVSLPQIKTRTAKLEKEERAKRQRKKEQQQRSANKQSSQQQQSSTFTGENDGSKEGRKAERERRRAEHYAKNNIKEKTPEEIAEMERRRRQRMEEEAAKWNMEYDDIDYSAEGEEGGSDGSGSRDFYDDSDEEDNLDDEDTTTEDDEDDDEDDVMDLD